jgi:hypothetical protein
MGKCLCDGDFVCREHQVQHRNPRSVAERFGIPVPEEINREVDRIVDEKLGGIHTYYRDPQSGAGNCFCGHPERAWRHPHTFMKAAYDASCTCGLPLDAACHNPT